jgi:hypothetical protein
MTLDPEIDRLELGPRHLAPAVTRRPGNILVVTCPLGCQVQTIDPDLAAAAFCSHLGGFR